MLRRFYHLPFFIFLTFLSVGLNAGACPLNGPLVDFNCDGQIKYVFTGDSIVAGKGDNPGRQGYVGRLSAAMPEVTVENLGIGGIRSYQLVAAFRRRTTKGPQSLLTKSEHADFVMIDVGRNDYLGRKQPIQVIREIKRLVRYLQTSIAREDGTAPFVAVATLLPVNSPRRGDLKDFVKQVNHLLLVQKQKGTLPVYIRFDRIPASLISRDGLHPSPEGFQAMTTMMEGFINGELQDLLRLGQPATGLDTISDDEGEGSL